MNAAAIILAGGASIRMGAPKALLDIDGETLGDRMIRLFRSSCRDVILVLGHDAERIRAGIRKSGDAIFVSNPDPARGQLSSLQCGLRAIVADVDAVLFTPIDYPRLRENTPPMLLNAFSGDEDAVVPTFEGRRGHPVLVSRRLASELLALPSDASAREVMRSHRDGTRYLSVDDRGILLDVDYPEDLRRTIEAVR